MHLQIFIDFILRWVELAATPLQLPVKMIRESNLVKDIADRLKHARTGFEEQYSIFTHCKETYCPRLFAQNCNKLQSAMYGMTETL